MSTSIWTAYAYKTAAERSAELRAYLTVPSAVRPDRPESALKFIGTAPTREAAEQLLLAAHSGGHVCDHDGGRWDAADIGYRPDWLVARDRRVSP